MPNRKAPRSVPPATPAKVVLRPLIKTSSSTGDRDQDQNQGQEYNPSASGQRQNQGRDLHRADRRRQGQETARRTEKEIPIPDPMDAMGCLDFDPEKDYDESTEGGERRDGSNQDGGAVGQGSLPKQTLFDTKTLLMRLAGVASTHGLEVDDEVAVYISLATEQHLLEVVERMVLASKHRRNTQPDVIEPGHNRKIVIEQCPKKELLAIERVEREQELQRKAQLSRCRPSQAGAQHFRRRKPTLESVKIYVPNQTLLQLVGGFGKRYSWMDAEQKLSQGSQSQAQSKSEDSTDLGSVGSMESRRVRLGDMVSVRDALFALESRGDTGSRGGGQRTLVRGQARRLR